MAKAMLSLLLFCSAKSSGRLYLNFLAFLVETSLVAFITFGSSSFVDLFLNPNVAGFQNLIEHPDVVPPEYSRSLYF